MAKYADSDDAGTPRNAPVSGMHRLIWLISAWLCVSCASNESAVQSAYRDYIDNCRNQRTEQAAAMVTDVVAEPCPAVVEQLPPDEAFETVASMGPYVFVDSGGGFRLDAHQMLNYQELGSVLLRIKYALQTRDAELFHVCLAPSLNARYPRDSLAEQMFGDPDLNALYAALAASSLDDMACERQDKGARCFVSGMTLMLGLFDHEWKLAGFE